MNISDYLELVGTEKEIEWLESLPLTRESVDTLVDYIGTVVSPEACLLFLEWTDMLSIETIEKLSITPDDIKTVVDEIIDNFDKDFIMVYFNNSTYNSCVLDFFEERGIFISSSEE